MTFEKKRELIAIKMTSQYGWKRFSDIVIYYIIIRDNIISPGIL
jgi:hypothetical protein